MKRAATTLALALGLLVFLGLPAIALADNGGDHVDGWAQTAAAALAAASGGGLAALIGRWLNPPPTPPPAIRKGPGRFDGMDRRRAGPPRDYLRQAPAPPPPSIEPPADDPPPEQSNAYEPGGISTRN